MEAYIGHVPPQFDRAPLGEKVTIAHISKVIPANWKVVNEAFLEAFHVHTTHPQWTTAYSDHLHRYDVFDNYSRVIIRSEEHTSELQSLMRISYAVFCLKKKKTNETHKYDTDKSHE